MKNQIICIKLFEHTRVHMQLENINKMNKNLYGECMEYKSQRNSYNRHYTKGGHQRIGIIYEN